MSLSNEELDRLKNQKITAVQAVDVEQRHLNFLRGLGWDDKVPKIAQTVQRLEARKTRLSAINTRINLS